MENALTYSSASQPQEEPENLTKDSGSRLLSSWALCTPRLPMLAILINQGSINSSHRINCLSFEVTETFEAFYSISCELANEEQFSDLPVLWWPQSSVCLLQ